MEKILSLTVRLYCGSEVEAEVLLDTTMQEKKVPFSTHTKLALKIIKYCWAYGAIRYGPWTLRTCPCAVAFCT